MARVPYRSKDDVPDEYRALLDENNMGDLQAVLNLFRGLANCPPILRSYILWSRTIWDNCGLSERVRELVILQLARSIESRYEWGQHVPIAIDSGVTIDEIKAVSEGRLEQFDDQERVLLQYADLFADRSVDDAVHEALTEFFDESDVVGISVLCSHYVATAGIVDSLAIDLEGEFVGWDLEKYN